MCLSTRGEGSAPAAPCHSRGQRWLGAGGSAEGAARRPDGHAERHSAAAPADDDGSDDPPPRCGRSHRLDGLRRRVAAAAADDAAVAWRPLCCRCVLASPRPTSTTPRDADGQHRRRDRRRDPTWPHPQDAGLLVPPAVRVALNGHLSSGIFN